MRCVELKAGVQFMRIGAPQAVDIIKAGARDAIRCDLYTVEPPIKDAPNKGHL